jgi:hypothetical protein
MRVKVLKDNELPRWKKSNKERAAPSLAKLLNAKELPK